MKKYLLCLLTLSLILCGCEKSSKDIQPTPSSDVSPVVSTDEPSISDSTVNNGSTNNSSTNTGESKDKIVLGFVNEENQNISKTNTIDDAKNKFTNLIDFIFNGGEINGVKFNELSDDAKKKVVDATISIDSKIESKWPGYKNTIKEKSSIAYSKVTSSLKDLSSSYNNKIKETIGDDAYNRTSDSIKEQTSGAGEVISGVINEAKDIGKSAINSVKDWFTKKN